MNQELLKKARAAKSPEELLKLAHENGMEEFGEESAKAYLTSSKRRERSPKRSLKTPPAAGATCSARSTG